MARTADLLVRTPNARGEYVDQLAYTRLGLAASEPTAEGIETLGRVSGEIWLGALTRRPA